MRINLRLRINDYTIFGMLSKTQKLIGITSKVIGEKDKHYIFWDLENCTLKQAEQELSILQFDYSLGTTFITSDYPYSFRAWCFDKVSFKQYLKILLDTKYLDWNFFYWTVERGKATLRLNQKKGRQQQKIVSILESPYEQEWNELERKKKMESNIFSRLERVDYETGIDKKGVFKEFSINAKQKQN
jgi:hypothetical protein